MARCGVWFAPGLILLACTGGAGDDLSEGSTSVGSGLPSGPTAAGPTPEAGGTNSGNVPPSGVPSASNTEGVVMLDTSTSPAMPNGTTPNATTPSSVALPAGTSTNPLSTDSAVPAATSSAGLGGGGNGTGGTSTTPNGGAGAVAQGNGGGGTAGGTPNSAGAAGSAGAAPEVPLVSVDSDADLAITTLTTNSKYHCRRTFGSGLYDSVSNKTFVTWNAPEMALYLREYDHTLSAWGAEHKAWEWNNATDNGYHDYGTLLMLPDGRLGIFSVNHNERAYLTKASSPNSIAGDWTRTQISSDLNSYPMPIVSGDTVYFFYSRSDDLSWPYRSYWYITSPDSGASWSSPIRAIDTGKADHKYCEVYAFGVHEEAGKIYMTWTMAGNGGHNKYAENLYLAYLDTADGNIYNAANESQGPHVDDSEMSSCLVISSAPDTSSTDYFELHPIQNSQPGVTADGTIVVGFGQALPNGDKVTKFGKYAAGAWQFDTVDGSAHRFMDMMRTGDDDFEILYMSSDMSRVVNQRTADNGATWTELYSKPVPYEADADTTFYVNFIEPRSSVRAFGATINYANRQIGTEGGWPVFAIESQ